MKQHNLLLSFDYELFLGSKSGTVDSCLIKPTELLAQVLEKNNAKAIFFVDATYLWKLSLIKGQFEKVAEDYRLIQHQLQKLALAGHYIYLHIHPHWIDAQYDAETNEWDLSNPRHYSFTSLNEIDREHVFLNAFESLKSILAGIDCKIDGFRAGGLFADPIGVFIPYFEKCGISCDFSVLPTFYSKSELHAFDYTQITDSYPYSFEETLQAVTSSGKFTEFPLTVNKVSIVQKICNSLYFRLVMNDRQKLAMGDGRSGGQKINSTLNSKFQFAETVSVELMNSIKAMYYSKILKETGYLHFLSHPKLCNEYTVGVFDRWLSECKNNLVLQTDFMGF